MVDVCCYECDKWAVSIEFGVNYNVCKIFCLLHISDLDYFITIKCIHCVNSSLFHFKDFIFLYCINYNNSFQFPPNPSARNDNFGVYIPWEPQCGWKDQPSAITMLPNQMRRQKIQSRCRAAPSSSYAQSNFICAHPKPHILARSMIIILWLANYYYLRSQLWRDSPPMQTND